MLLKRVTLEGFVHRFTAVHLTITRFRSEILNTCRFIRKHILGWHEIYETIWSRQQRKRQTRTLHVLHAFLSISIPSLHSCDVKWPSLKGVFFGENSKTDLWSQIIWIRHYQNNGRSEKGSFTMTMARPHVEDKRKKYNKRRMNIWNVDGLKQKTFLE